MLPPTASGVDGGRYVGRLLVPLVGGTRHRCVVQIDRHGRLAAWAVDKSDRRTAAEETADRSRAPHVWVFADEISAVSRGADEAVAADIEPAAELAVGTSPDLKTAGERAAGAGLGNVEAGGTGGGSTKGPLWREQLQDKGSRRKSVIAATLHQKKAASFARTYCEIRDGQVSWWADPGSAVSGVPAGATGWLLGCTVCCAQRPRHRATSARRTERAFTAFVSKGSRSLVAIRVAQGGNPMKLRC